MSGEGRTWIPWEPLLRQKKAVPGSSGLTCLHPTFTCWTLTQMSAPGDGRQRPGLSV